MSQYRRYLVPITGSADLSSVALSLTSTLSSKWKLCQVTLKASVAITETVTVTKVARSSLGSNYDTVLDTTNLSAASSYVFRPTGDCVGIDGDTIKVQCTKANNTGIVYAEIILEDLGKA